MADMRICSQCGHESLRHPAGVMVGDGWTEAEIDEANAPFEDPIRHEPTCPVLTGEQD